MMRIRSLGRPAAGLLASRAALAALFVVGAAGADAQTIQPPYAASYTLSDLGTVPGLPAPAGGLDFLPSDANVIVIGGSANSPSGQLFSIGVVRDAVTHHITGFTGTAAFYSAGQNNDGGVTFGPGGVLFYARYPSNQVGMVKPASTITDKVVDLTALGVASSVGALRFVPAGFPGAGQLKIVSYNSHKWYTASYAPDGSGTYDITAPVLETTIQGGPEGFVYVPAGSPVFPSGTNLLVSEYQSGAVTTYQVDAGGNPIPATRAVVVSGLTGAEGAVIDPVTGDFLFSTFGGGNRVIAVRGFAAPVNTPPTFTPVSESFKRVRGASPILAKIGTVSDVETPAGQLQVSVTSAFTGAVVNGITVAANGDVTANVGALCDTGGVTSGAINIQVADGVTTTPGSVTVDVLAVGDLNDDGIIDVFDLVIHSGYIVGNVTPGSPPFVAPLAMADLNGNLAIDVFDLVLLAGKIVGNVPCPP